MESGKNDWAEKAATLVAGGSGVALSLWWCFLGPNDGWGLWMPVALGPILGAVIWRTGRLRGARWKQVRGAEDAGLAAHFGREGKERTAFREGGWPEIRRGFAVQEGGMG